jgi:hypothetical protein
LTVYRQLVAGRELPEIDEENTMRKLRTWALTVGTVALLTESALAQRPGFGLKGLGGLQLLENKSVQKELKLGAQQAERATKDVEEIVANRDEMSKQLRAQRGLISEEELFRKQDDLELATQKESEKLLKDLLKPDQLTRFNQIYYQVFGVGSFESPEVLKQLKITADQAEAIRAVIESFQRDAREIVRTFRGTLAERRRQIAPLQKAKLEAINVLLTDDQKRAWEKMLGAPFELIL